jgi:hypothetical protein
LKNNTGHGACRHGPLHPIIISGIIILSRSSWYNHDVNRRGRRVNKSWIEKTVGRNGQGPGVDDIFENRLLMMIGISATK